MLKYRDNRMKLLKILSMLKLVPSAATKMFVKRCRITEQKLKKFKKKNEEVLSISLYHFFMYFFVVFFFLYFYISTVHRGSCSLREHIPFGGNTWLSPFAIQPAGTFAKSIV